MTPLTRTAIRSLATWTWLESTAVGRVAFVLAAHPQGAPQAAALAAALRLAEPSRRIPYIGERVVIGGPGGASLSVDGCAYRISLTVGEQWLRYVSTGGPVAVLVGLDPLPRRARQEVVAEYLTSRTRSGRIRMGTTAMWFDGQPPA